MTELHADVVVRVEDLDSLRESWEALGAHAPTADPEHFRTVLAHRPEAVRPHVMRLARGDEAVALVVGRIEDIALPARVGYRTVLAPRLRALTVVQSGYLGDASEPIASRVLSELMRVLDRGEADVLRFRLLEVGSPLHRLARTEPGSLRRERQSRPSIHWQASIPDSFDEFLRARSKSTRSNIRYYGNRVRNQFGDRARLETFHDGSDLERLQRDAALVAAKTYQHGLGASFEDNELQQALTALAARRGWLRAYVLYLDEDPVAFWLANAFDGVVYTGYTGYDPAHRDARLGTFVLARLIEDACADPGISHVDFGYGDADYKRQMADTTWLEEDVLVFGPSLKALRSNLGRTAVLGAGEVGRRLLAKGDAVARTKRWWRDRLRSREA